MDNNQKFWIRIISLVCLSIITVALIVASYNYKVEISAMDRGYQKIMMPYAFDKVYQKAD